MLMLKDRPCHLHADWSELSDGPTPGRILQALNPALKSRPFWEFLSCWEKPFPLLSLFFSYRSFALAVLGRGASNHVIDDPALAPPAIAPYPGELPLEKKKKKTGERRVRGFTPATVWAID